MQLVADLSSRGLLHQASTPDLDERLAKLAGQRAIGAYAGFDPTADSLHVGHFMGILGLIYAQRNGIRPIAIVGGATGLIGDPSGKTTERPLLTKEDVGRNVEGIKKVLAKFLDFNHPTAPALIVNNLDWFGPMSVVDFLRDVGRAFRLGPMLSKESVKLRMESSDEGMSYTEFSYQLLQGYDFYRLYKDHGVVLQLGGSDQWGNITAGIDVIRKLEGESGHAFALTWPLLLDSNGRKMGKSEGNPVWLSPEKTSPFDFYQYWIREVQDADVERFLKNLTFLPLPEIAAVVAEHQKAPEKRLGQRRLAEEVTRIVHGEEATKQAIAASNTLYGGGGGGGVEQLDAAAVQALVAQGVQAVAVDRAKLEVGYPVIDACVDSGLAKSKSEARRVMQQGGLYVNNVAVSDPAAVLKADALVAGIAIVLRSGKRNYRLVKVGG
jgi:tyrosyl-tRNA synthetase